MFLFQSDPLLVVLVARMGTFGSISNRGLAGSWGRTSTPDPSFRRPQPPNILVRSQDWFGASSQLTQHFERGESWSTRNPTGSWGRHSEQFLCIHRSTRDTARLHQRRFRERLAGLRGTYAQHDCIHPLCHLRNVNCWTDAPGSGSNSSERQLLPG